MFNNIEETVAIKLYEEHLLKLWEELFSDDFSQPIEISMDEALYLSKLK
ncbi:MAG: hypothetical protein V1891_02510 [bacterium]